MQSAPTLLYNRYSILHVESSNSFNKVFFVLDTYQDPPRNCVIKIFEPIVEKLQITKWIDREFQKEANRLKQLSLDNPHLPEIYTYSNDARTYYIVRELIEGQTLKEKVATTGVLPVPEVREILIKLLSVLDYLHSQGVIHQNIKPKNIILRNDRLPMLINFGSIKQIVSTYGFYGDKQIFFSNNVCGYAPPEQALGRVVPASDLYSLGLTAIYLLTAQDPLDLPINSNSGNFNISATIGSLDSNLAKIITRAISANLSDRYDSASEMLDDLLNANFALDNRKSAKKQHRSISPRQIRKIKRKNNRNPLNGLDLWAMLMCALGSLYIIGIVITIWHDWNLNQNALVMQLSKPLTSKSSLLTAPPEEPVANRPSILNNSSKDLVEIPIFALGTQKEKLRQALGEPNAIQKGYWANSNAWIYKDRANGLVDLGYLFDLQTNKLRQTEVAVVASLGLATTKDILASLLEGNITPSVIRELEKIYQYKADKYFFRIGNLKGSIEREEDDNIYLGVWEADFH
ncbi:MAG: serine/threonine-protein kinase [Pleurocapsa sp. MO_226.B13]|nr:serine/threonine-protein kinase [Pleurocapsa sp. MO_226.B13]